jgi:hypothetical protein
MPIISSTTLGLRLIRLKLMRLIVEHSPGGPKFKEPKQVLLKDINKQLKQKPMHEAKPYVDRK